MLIKRDLYLRQLIDGQGNGLIKIITGLRRSGKSWLLFKIFAKYLLENGILEDHIIRIDLEDRRNAKLRDPDELLHFVDASIKDNAAYYILIDEVQHVPQFEDALNSIIKLENVDLYVTGSNSRFLSTDIATIFRGRGYQVHVWPLSFAEYMTATKLPIGEAWKDYYTYGGLPHILSLKGDQQKSVYLRDLHATVYLADIVDRHKLKGQEGIGELLEIAASCIGSLTNPNKLANTFKSARRSALSYKTIAHYLDLLCDAFLTEKALRYDIRGKKYINALCKYYFTDLGIRNAILDFRQQEETHIMENIIYNELRLRGYMVDVGIASQRTTENGSGVTRQYEVDFVANMANRRYYIQSALALPSREKIAQESAAFRLIGDSFKKIVITREDIKPKLDTEGILTIGLFDFLLNPKSLDL